jgi:Uncharacterized protein conserved in bacteria (DUF2252)
MAVKEAVPRYRRINYPSLDERLDQGRTARDRTPPSRRAQKNLAKAHTRDSVQALSILGEVVPVATAEYLAGDDAFDQSITDFCERYADQNEQDHAEFGKAVRSGRLEAVEGV